jgi:hypothetical protein
MLVPNVRDDVESRQDWYVIKTGEKLDEEDVGFERRLGKS